MLYNVNNYTKKKKKRGRTLLNNNNNNNLETVSQMSPKRKNNGSKTYM